MDGSHFDTLARSIAYGGTRRRLMIRLLGGVVLGAPLALLGQGDHAAKGKKGAAGGRAPTAMGIAAGATRARTVVSAGATTAAVPHDRRANGWSVARTRMRVRSVAWGRATAATTTTTANAAGRWCA
jgi:hypothetical protein